MSHYLMICIFGAIFDFALGVNWNINSLRKKRSAFATNRYNEYYQLCTRIDLLRVHFLETNIPMQFV